MADTSEKNAKILKTIIVFIVAFFLFIIVFNIWMKASLEKSGVASSSKVMSTKPQIKKTAAPMQEQVIPSQKTGETEKQYEGTSTAEGQLILQ